MTAALLLTDSKRPPQDGTDWKDEARAMAAADPRLTNAEIARRVGRTDSAVWKALHPEITREWNRKQNRKRHEVKLAWQREKDHSPEGRSTCEQCGELCGVGSAHDGTRHCEGCLAANHDKRARRFAEMWNAGATYADLRAEFGISNGTVSSTLRKLRDEGYDVPHRRTPEQLERMHAARWGAAA